MSVREVHERLSRSLKPFLVRHRRDEVSSGLVGRLRGQSKVDRSRRTRKRLPLEAWSGRDRRCGNGALPDDESGTGTEGRTWYD